jgi:3-isopropylmalate/(R)-2-methylmalate dehydratase small subunit
MSGWKFHTGAAVSLPFENIDTDQLIPARFMSAPRSEGYGKYLLTDLRYGSDGKPTDFPEMTGATVIVASRNFGCGSSREAAVYALADFAIRVVVAESFGDIFASNAVNNGVLPARVTSDVIEELMRELAHGLKPIVIDLEAQELTVSGRTFAFDLDPVWRQKLLNGWDDIDLTQNYASELDAFSQRYMAEMPWIRPSCDGRI